MLPASPRMTRPGYILSVRRIALMRVRLDGELRPIELFWLARQTKPFHHRQVITCYVVINNFPATQTNGWHPLQSAYSSVVLRPTFRQLSEVFRCPYAFMRLTPTLLTVSNYPRRFTSSNLPRTLAIPARRLDSQSCSPASWRSLLSSPTWCRSWSELPCQAGFAPW